MHGKLLVGLPQQHCPDPKIGLFRLLLRFRGFQVWSWGLAMFGVTALVVLLLTAIRPDLRA
jgi:hypothetical protein